MTRQRRSQEGSDQRVPSTGRGSQRKALSQNFLLPPGVNRYLSAVSPHMGDLAIEVGAGDGALTPSLAKMHRTLIAYEIDRYFAQRLAGALKSYDNVRVIEGDFLRSAPPKESFHVVGNVPFSRTSEIVGWCLGATFLGSCTIVTQLEYARKRSGDYGRWTLLTVKTWPFFEWKFLDKIPRHQFHPVPRTDAAILQIARRSAPLIPPSSRRRFEEMVELGFTGKGGSLYASLSHRYTQRRTAAAFARINLPKSTVVAYVRPDQWMDLFEALQIAENRQPAKTKHRVRRQG